MDFADAPEDAAFRRELRTWLETNLTDDLKVEDAQDQRVSPDRETWNAVAPGRKKCTPPAGSGSPGRRNMAGAAPASCSRSSSTRSIFAPAPRSCPARSASASWTRP